MMATISPTKANKRVFVRMLSLYKWYLILGGLYLATIILDPLFEGGLHIPCLFRSLFGINCPGCGMSRAIGALIKGDLEGAWQYNPQLFIVIPILFIALLYQWRSIYHQIVHANSVP